MVTRGGIRTSSSSHSRWRAQMPPGGRHHQHYDSKFQPYDCVPSHEEWAAFSRNLLGLGGRGNENGDSLAHAFLGTYHGGPNGPVHRGTGVALQKSLAATRKLKGEAFSFIYEHITDEHHREHLSETYGVGSPGNNYGDPHGAYRYLMAECDVLPNRDGEEEQDIEWLQFGIAKNVGKHENTIKEMLKILRSMNIPRSALRKKTSDEIVEKILRCIYAATSDAIGTEASRELEAVQGVPGQPGVRMFQHPLGMGAAAGNTRDLPGLIRHFHEGWSKAIKAGHIATCKATMHQSSAVF